MKHQHITALVAFNTNLQLAHWQADTVTNVHRTLGDLYEQTVDLVDKLAEVFMGKRNDRTFLNADIKLVAGADVKELLAVGIQAVADARTGCTAGEDDDLLNILADISSAINRAKYLLKI